VPFKLASIMSFTGELARSTNIEGAIRNLLQQSIAEWVGQPCARGQRHRQHPRRRHADDGLNRRAARNRKCAKTSRRCLPRLDNALAGYDFHHVSRRALFVSAVLPAGFAYSVAASSALAPATVVAIDPNGVAAALGGEPRILISEGAAIHEDDVPLPIGSPGSPPTIAGAVRGLFQTDALPCA